MSKKNKDCTKGKGNHLCLCPVCVAEGKKQKATQKILKKLDKTFVSHSELASQVATLVEQYLIQNPPTGGLTEADVNNLIKNYLLSNPQGLTPTQVNNLIQQYLSTNQVLVPSWIGSIQLLPGVTYYSTNPTTSTQDPLLISSAVDNSLGAVTLNTDGTFTINESGIYAMGLNASYADIVTSSGGGVGIGLYGGSTGTTYMGLGMIGMSAAVTNPMELLPPITGPATINLKVYTGQIGLSPTTTVTNAVWLTIIKIA